MVGIPAVKDASAGLEELTARLEKLGAVIGEGLLAPLKTSSELLGKLGVVLSRELGPALAVATEKVRFVGDFVKALFSNIATIITESLSPLADRVGKVLAPIGERIGRALAPAVERLRFAGDFIKFTFAGIAEKIGENMPAMSRAGGAIGSVIGTVGASLGAMAVGAVAAVGALIAVGSAMGAFVSKANPALFNMFTMALEDMMAVIGQGLTPVFKLVIEIIRMFADTLTGLVPIGAAAATVLKPLVAMFGILFEVVGQAAQGLGRVFERMAPALNALGGVMVAFYQAIQPLYELFIDLVGGALVGAVGLVADALGIVIPYITAFARVVGDMVKQLMKWVRDVLAFIGIELDDTPGTKKNSSWGMAAKSTNIGSVESALQSAQKSAYGIGLGAQDPASKTAGAAEEIKRKTEAIYKFITEELPKKFDAWFGGLPGNLARAIRDGAVKMIPSVPRSGDGSFVDRNIIKPHEEAGNIISDGWSDLGEWLERQRQS